MSFLGGVVGTVIGAYSANRQNQQARAAASRQMDFQREMSNTAHFREVADLRKAGLNPILSANTGASSPGGSQPPVVNQATSAREAMLSLAQVKLLNEQTRATKYKADIDRPKAIAMDALGSGMESGATQANSAKSLTAKEIFDSTRDGQAINILRNKWDKLELPWTKTKTYSGRGKEWRNPTYDARDYDSKIRASRRGKNTLN